MSPLSLATEGRCDVLAPFLVQSSSGLLVESVVPDTALAAAGLRPGDLVTGWRLEVDSHEVVATDRPERFGESVELTSPFDWLELEMEYAHRPGPVTIFGQRAAEPFSVAVDEGEWRLRLSNFIHQVTQVRPVMGFEAEKVYLAGRLAFEAGDIHRGVETWRSLAERWPRFASWIFYRIGIQLASLDRWDDARPAFEEALAVSQQPFDRTLLQGYIAKSYEYTSQLESALEHYVEALEVQEHNPPAGLVASWCHQRIGSMLLFFNAYESASEHFRAGLEIRRRLAPDSYLVADSLHGIGLVDNATSRLAQAEEAFRDAMEIQETVVPRSVELAATLESFGSVLAQRRDVPGALASFEEVLATWAGTDDRADQRAEATSLIHIARTHLLDGRTAEAETRLRRAENLLLAEPADSDLRLLLHHSLGWAAMIRQRWEEAEGHYRTAVDVEPTTGRGALVIALNLGALGELLLHQKEYEPAELYLGQAAEIVREALPASDSLAIVLHQKGQLYRRTGRSWLAAGTLLEAIDVLEAQISRLGGTKQARREYRRRKRELYVEAIAAWVDVGRPDVAFHVSERYRAQELLHAAAWRPPHSPASLDLSPRLSALQRHYDRLLEQSRLAETPEQRERLVRERKRVLDAYERQAEAELGQAATAASAAVRPDVLGVSRALDSVPPQTLALSYSVGETRTDLFVLSRGQLRSHVLPVSKTSLEGKVDLWLKLITLQKDVDGGLESVLEIGESLRRLLLAPVEDDIRQADMIVVAPDGPLHLLPFAALPSAPGASSDSATYLVEQAPVQYAFSITTLVMAARRTPRPRSPGGPETRALVAVGAPSMGGYARIPEPPQTPSGALEKLSFGLGPWDELPSTREEIEAVTSLYPSEETLVLLGAEATEERVMAAAPQARILHIATHGYLDDSSPLDSSLVLARPADHSAERGENGLLQAWEIFEQLRIDADLVVLSACRSGDGGDMGGEGLVGLSQAFFHAGASQIVASSWLVYDSATADLMTAFHRHLRAGRDAARALRLAQIDMIGQDPAGPWSSPYFWAAFRVIGHMASRSRN